MYTKEIQPVPKFISAENKDEDIQPYCEHLDAHFSGFNQRFDDIL